MLGAVLAAASDLPAIPVAFVSAGLSALVTILSGKIVVPTFAYNREKDRADRYEALLLEKVLPVSAEMVRVTSDFLDDIKARRHQR